MQIRTAKGACDRRSDARSAERCPPPIEGGDIWLSLCFLYKETLISPTIITSSIPRSSNRRGAIDPILVAGHALVDLYFLHFHELAYSEGMLKNISFRTPYRAVLKECFRIMAPKPMQFEGFIAPQNPECSRIEGGIP